MRRRTRYSCAYTARFIFVIIIIIIAWMSSWIANVNGVDAFAIKNNSNPSPSKAVVAVLGATGQLGQATVEELLKRGIPIKCLVRPSSVDKLPERISSNPLVEIVVGELLSKESVGADGIYTDENAKASQSLASCLEGCSVCIACYGATRRTKPKDFFVNPEDTDPTHAKQINYRSMLALKRACESETSTIQHIVRVTGKGENPEGIFTILLNGLGSYCKLWNYQGEVVLRSSSNKNGIGYTIVRPGVMSKDLEDSERYLELADNGGNDLPVTKMSYGEVANLLVEVASSVESGSVSIEKSNNRVTLAAMNEPKAAPNSLAERIAGLRNDSRSFPQSLVTEHKGAVNGFLRRIVLVGASVFATGMFALFSRIL